MVKNTKKAADLIVGLAVMITSIIFFLAALDMPDSTRGIGPGDYPMFVCVLLFILGLVQVVSVIISVKGIPLIDFKGINRKYLLRALIMFAATYLYYLLIRPVGFPLSTIAFLIFSMLFFGYKKKVKAVIISVVFTLAVYFLFVRVFQVMLPSGYLF